MTTVSEATEIRNTEDTIDSRDVTERIEYLKDIVDAGNAEEPLTPDEDVELKALLALQDDLNICDDWQYGVTLIRESFFEEYAQDLAVDIGCITNNTHCPLGCLDWKTAAWRLHRD